MGPIITIIVVGAIIYGMVRLLLICDLIEEDKNNPAKSLQQRNEKNENYLNLEENSQKNKFSITSYHQIADHLDSAEGPILTILSVVCNIGLLIGYSLANYVYLSKFFSPKI